MAYKIFIDGRDGTTGLKICERFENRNDIELLEISEEKRKDKEERARLINESDYTFLCLPDVASIESAALCTNPNTVLIDGSTAHRIDSAWAYGFPELSKEHRKNIETSKRISVPGCYATGFISLVNPLVAHDVIASDYPVTCHAVSGYSGAGKKAIIQYEDKNRNPDLNSPREYALTQMHKHLPEMQKLSHLDFAPIFNPYICDYFAGMSVTVPLYSRLLKNKMSAKEVQEVMAAHYEGSKFVKVAPFMGDGILNEPFIPANTLAGTNNLEIFVFGNDERIILCSRFDNLGKGSSGAAVQCLNISMGIDEGFGL